MERRILGRTGLPVSGIGIGSAQFGSFGLKDEATCVRVAHAAFDAGVNLIDTADFYLFGRSETVVGKVVADRRDKIILATKCGMPVSADPGERGGSRRWIHTAVERSLKRLKTDYIDIYQLHMPDPATEIEETLDAMNDLMRGGKIRYYGTSNFSGLMSSEAQLRARLRGFTPPHSEQSSYSILNRAPEAELLPVCHKYGVGFLAYSPLDSGWLSGKYRQSQEFEKSPRQRIQPYLFDRTSPGVQQKLEAVEKLAALCDEAGIEMAHLAVGFVLAHKAVGCALIGGSKPEHFELNLRGQDVILSDEVLDKIDEIVAPGTTVTPGGMGAATLGDKDLRRAKRVIQDSATAEALLKLMRSSDE